MKPKYLPLLMLSVLLSASCEKKEDYGSDDSMPVAVDICYDDVVSNATTLAVYWNSRPAINAGAESFTVQLVKSDKANAGDNYNTSLSTTYAVTGMEYPGQAVFQNLKTGAKYYVRVRANYPGGKTSKWEYLFDDSLARTGVIKVGTGLVEEPISRIAETSATLVNATSSTLSFSFSSTKYLEYDTDAERTYMIALYNDEGCSDLVVSWKIDPNCGTGFSPSNHPCFIFTGLDSGRDYWFQATDVTDGGNSPSNVVKARTSDFTPKKVEGAVNPGDVILAEDFSELIWGGSYLNSENAAGYSSKSRGNAPEFKKAAGVNPIDGTYQYYLVGIGQDMQLFGSLLNAIPSSRLAGWGYMAEGDNTACMCSCASHVKCGTGAGAASIVTPELGNLSGPAKISVSFKAQSLGSSDSKSMAVEVLHNSSRNGSYCVSAEDSDKIKAVQFEVSSFTTATPYSFEISGVLPGDRIAIGGDVSKKTASAPMRCFFDDIVIKLVEYE